MGHLAFIKKPPGKAVRHAIQPQNNGAPGRFCRSSKQIHTLAFTCKNGLWPSKTRSQRPDNYSKKNGVSEGT